MISKVKGKNGDFPSPRRYSPAGGFLAQPLHLSNIFILFLDSYLLELTRYIHLNPVHAGMAPTPDQYPWSGHREQSEGKPRHQIHLKGIIAAVCRVYGIGEKDIATPGKYRLISEARGMAAWSILETDPGPLPNWGRNATTSSRVTRQLQFKAKTDPALADKWQRLLKELVG